MAAPRPSSSVSLDGIYLPCTLPCTLPPPSPPSPHIILDTLVPDPDCGFFYTEDPPSFVPPPLVFPGQQQQQQQPTIIHPPEVIVRGRSPTRSPSPLSVQVPICNFIVRPPSIYEYSPSRTRSSSRDSRSPSPLRMRRECPYYRGSSRSSSPRRRRRRSRSPTIVQVPPPVTVIPSQAPIWPPTPVPEPVDILTFHHNKNMAYAPAAKTYDGAIDNVLELWPELREVDRERIQLFVGCSEQLVRVPKMAWQLVLCDFPRYEVVHVQVDQPPPPPQYQGDGTWAGGDEKKAKRARSRGFFASIKRIFGR